MKLTEEENAAKAWEPKTDHTDAEKVAAFDRMHEFAMGYVKALKDNERFKDAEHYMYETMLEQTVSHEPTTGGDDFWEFRNNVPRDWEE